MRGRRPEVFCEKDVLRNFAKFRPATLLKKRIWHGWLPGNVAKFLRIPFLTEHLWWLLLNFDAVTRF